MTVQDNHAWNANADAAYTIQSSRAEPSGQVYAGVVNGVAAPSSSSSIYAPYPNAYGYRQNYAYYNAKNLDVSVVPPPVPQGLVATSVSNVRIDLSWTPSTGATSYLVERSSDNVNWSQIVSVTNTSDADSSGLQSSTLYDYRVRAVNTVGDSPYSNIASATTGSNSTTTTLYSFDFGTGNSPVAAGYTQVTNNTWYGQGLGYGWKTLANGQALDRGTGWAGANDLTRDFVYGTDMTFQVALPNGTYEVTPTVGDLVNFAHAVNVSVQGAEVDNVATAGGQVVTRTYLAVVTNGLLDLELQGVQQAVGSQNSDGLAVIEALTILPLAFDFGINTSPVAAGYTQVTNNTWSPDPLGSGWTNSQPPGYGWALLGGTAGAQDRGTGWAGANDLTRDYVYSNAPLTSQGATGMAFRVDLPNGTYDVTPTLGDVDSFQPHGAEVYLQGAWVENVVTVGGQVVSPTFVVTVTNGYLSLGLQGVQEAVGNQTSDGYAVIEALTISLVPPVQVSLSGAFNLDGITADNNTAPGNIDGGGASYSANLLGSSVTAGGLTYSLGAAGTNNVVQATGQTIALPAGNFSGLSFLGTGVNGAQTGSFTVHYTDGTSVIFTQTLDDWYTDAGQSGEMVAAALAYRNTHSGPDNRTFRLYAYRFALDPGKAVQSITLPGNSNIELLAIDLLS